MGHDGLTRSPSGLSERRTGFSPPELGSPTAPVVPPTGAVPCPDCRRCWSGPVVGRRHRSGVAPPGRGQGRGAASSTGAVARRPSSTAEVVDAGRRREMAHPRAMSPAAALDRRRRGLRRPRREHARPRRGSPARRDRAAVRRRRPRPPARWSRGHRRRRAPARPAVGRPAPRARPGAARGPAAGAARTRTGAPCSRPAAVRRRTCRRPRCATCSPRSPGARRASCSTCPASSPVLRHVLAARRRWSSCVVGLRTRALADADAAVSRLLDRPGGARRAARRAPRHPWWPRRARRGRRRRRRAPRGRPPAPPRRRPPRVRATPSAGCSPASPATRSGGARTPWSRRSTAVAEAS